MRLRSIFLSCIIIMSFLQEFSARAQENAIRTLIAMGGNYSENLQGFLDAVISKAVGEEVKILLLYVAYGNDSFRINQVERNENFKLAEEQRSQIEIDCQRNISPGVKCIAKLVPILVRSDTSNQDIIQALEDQPTAILILGGDQITTIQTIAGTPVEIALSHAYQRGVIIAGTSAGTGLQSTSMLAGYNENFKAVNSFNFGASNVWNTPQKRGLFFGIQDAIVDPHFYEQNRPGRLLNAIALPNTPHLGVGIDVETGIHVLNEDRLENVFGLNTVTILDAETYHSADAVQYQGPEHLLSLRNVLIHMLSSGDFTYSLKERKHSLAPVSKKIERNFNHITLPSGAGSIIICNNLYDTLSNNPILTRFINISGGKKANILIVTVGYPPDEIAREAADAWTSALNVPTQTFIASPDSARILKINRDITGIIFISGDRPYIQPQSIAAIRNAWLSGTPLLIDGAASATSGRYYLAHSLTPDSEEGKESSTQVFFHRGSTEILPGLSLLNLNIEPQVLEKNRWGQLFSLAYKYPNLLSFGLTEGAALEITSDGAISLGDNVIISLDFSQATLDIGTNQGFVIANGLLDVFVPGDLIEPENADVENAPIRFSTPSIYSITPTIPTSTRTPTQTSIPSLTQSPTPEKQTGILKGAPSKTPRPMYASINIPPADPNLARLIIGAGILIVVVLIIGVWINRYRLR